MCPAGHPGAKLGPIWGGRAAGGRRNGYRTPCVLPAVKVLCVGKNYARHAREMGGPPPTSPVWFWKPDSSVVGEGEPVELPAGVGAVHHEVEMAVRLGARARRVDSNAAGALIDAVTIAVDVTARELQAEAKRLGQPWAQAKGFDTFLPLGAWQDVAGLDLQDQRLRLAVNGQLRQEGWTGDMTWSVASLVGAASQWTTLEPGDILLTGTPEGVGPIVDGDRMEAELVGLVRVSNPVATRT